MPHIKHLVLRPLITVILSLILAIALYHIAQKFNRWSTTDYDTAIRAGNYEAIVARLRWIDFEERRGAMTALVTSHDSCALQIALDQLPSNDPVFPAIIATHFHEIPESYRSRFLPELSRDPSLLQALRERHLLPD